VIEQRLQDWLRDGLRSAAPALGLNGDLPDPALEEPRQKEHGDFATNVALAIAKRAGKSPREVAQVVVDALPAAPFVERVEVAGPGFINIWTTDEWLHEVVRTIAAQGNAYGRAEPNGTRVQVEFVSANPTGPLHVGTARNAVLGDAVASLLDAAGHTVEREYYFNDAGGQMDRFGASVEARYLQALGRDAEVPEDGYQGDYVTAYALDILREHGDALADLPADERFERLRTEGARRAMDAIRATLARFGVVFDSYVSEASLEEQGEIAEAIERLRSAGQIYDQDGAVWFRSTTYGDDKDRVLIRSNGRHTYFAADCAYLIDKFRRGFQHLVYVWGADHHGDVARVKGAAEALGLDPGRVELLIYQFVSFLRGGEPLAGSGKRTGSFVSLDELLDEVGTDAARFHLLLFSNDHSMRFDLEEVARRSMDNPVYYVQYGHARIASILRTADESGIALRPIEDVDLSTLGQETESDLLRALADMPEVLARAAELRAPHRVAHAAQDIAKRFHAFYTECRVIGDDVELTQARLWLARASQQVLANLLGILGVSAPERMERVDA
jgi:arginyl-tRNA synthetase